MCRAQLWHASLRFSAPASGVRAVMVTPTRWGISTISTQYLLNNYSISTHYLHIIYSSSSSHWVTDNFILGSRLEHSLHWTGDCCTHNLRSIDTE